MIEYKGYIGVIDFNPEIDLFHGTVVSIQDVITFYGASVTELREEMQKSLEVYFEVCEEEGKYQINLSQVHSRFKQVLNCMVGLS